MVVLWPDEPGEPRQEAITADRIAKSDERMVTTRVLEVSRSKVELHELLVSERKAAIHYILEASVRQHGRGVLGKCRHGLGQAPAAGHARCPARPARAVEGGKRGPGNFIDEVFLADRLGPYTGNRGVVAAGGPVRAATRKAEGQNCGSWRHLVRLPQAHLNTERRIHGLNRGDMRRKRPLVDLIAPQIVQDAQESRVDRQ